MVNQRISIKDVNISIDGKVIGGVEEVTFTVARDNEEAYEAGGYNPIEIVGGRFHISGTMTRAFVDIDLLNQLMPNQAIPVSFTLVGEIISGKTPGRTVVLHGVTPDSVDINGMGLDSYAKNSIPFKALSWKFS